jgi:glucosamine-6-phosphate deaminase
MTIRVFDTAANVARALADRVAAALSDMPTLVLGLAAGRTPVDAYAELMAGAAAGAVDFSRATSFNLDEFVGVAPDHPGSFRRFMREHFFRGVNLDPSRIQSLDGTAADLDAECARYESAIAAAGGIDVQVLGIGTNGHIGFNEPGTELVARTHRVRLADATREDNAALFGGDPSAVPAEALTMGVGTILQARAIVVAATGARKAEVVARAIRGPITTQLPASLLQLHQSVEIYLDRTAASKVPL